MAELKLRNGKIISDYGKPYIIAELANSHNGDMEIAKKMIDAAKAAGCDCVKFQSWTKNTLFSQKVFDDNYFLNDDYRNRTDYTLEQICEKFSISENQLKEMDEYCKKVGIDFSSSPFCNKEVDFLADNTDAPFIKIASMDLNNYPFLKYVALKQVPIVLATGLSDLAEVVKAVDTIEKAGNNKISLLHCISVYPPKFKDINLNNILTLRKMYPDYPIGFSDHSLGVEIPTAAVALGSCIIEKHITLDKDMFGWDHKISADPEELSNMVRVCNNVYEAMGTSKRVVGEDELIKRTAFRRSLVAANELEPGHVLKEEDVAIKRPGTGLAPELLNLLIGRTLKKKVGYDRMFEMEDFE